MSEQSEQLATFAASTELVGDTRVSVSARDFELTIDEPEDLGGTNQGPNPVEFVLGALGGCLSIVGHTVADEMQLEIEHLEVDLEGDLNPAKFMGADTDARAGYQEIRADIDVELHTADGNVADAATVDQWLETVESRCPVSDNLGAATPIAISQR